jgi:hypothetical protein
MLLIILLVRHPLSDRIKYDYCTLHHVAFVMEKLALVRPLPRSISLFQFSIIPPMLHSHLLPTLYNRINDRVVT